MFRVTRFSSSNQADFMDHHYIAEHNLTDRYALGKLSADAQYQFEEHLIDCRECQADLETIEDFRAALKKVAAEFGGYLLKIEESDRQRSRNSDIQNSFQITKQ